MKKVCLHIKMCLIWKWLSPSVSDILSFLLRTMFLQKPESRHWLSCSNPERQQQTQKHTHFDKGLLLLQSKVNQ